MRESVSLPQIDDALALVCTIPSDGRGERRLSVISLIALANSIRETEAGVSLSFAASTDAARMVWDFAMAERSCCAQFTYAIIFQPHEGAIELHVTAAQSLVRPLKDLYLGLAEEAHNV